MIVICPRTNYACETESNMGLALRRALYAGVVFWSALLLLLLQPLITRAILPWFGGSAGVWTTSMLFFQAVLLGGYAYAHLLHRKLIVKHQVLLHGALLLTSFLMLPLSPSPEWKALGKADPVPRILGLLATTVGLPYFLLSSTSPLLQSWFSRIFHTELPYRLFAVSNFGSLVALLSYPVLVEPWLTVSQQLRWWSVGFIGYAGICLAAAVLSWRRAAPAERGEHAAWGQKGTWLALSAVPSVLWLATGNQLSQDVAAVPFLWIMPLALYLLTFVLCFDSDRWYRPRVFRWILPLAWAGMVAVVSQRGYLDIRMTALVMLSSLFVCCMFCHGELARLKPETRLLTSYYLTMSAGGALGGLLVAFIAPRVFNDFLELPLAVLGCIVLALWLLYGLSGKRVLRVGAVAAAATVAAVVVQDNSSGNQVNIRNFYGILQVGDSGEGDDRYRVLFNGTIQHGIQYLAPHKSRIPTTYYGPASGAGIAMRVLQKRGPMHVGVIGLGVGTMAAYGRQNDRYRFYEINPAVIQLAMNDFRYLSESPADITVVSGDARLSLEREPPQNFDLLVVDAFSGDSIPVHLLTREAIELYFQHLAPDGAIAVHITNKHLELAPVVKLLADSQQATNSVIHNTGQENQGIYISSWAIVTKDPELAREINWLSSPVPRNERLRLWTDDYSNLLFILR
jgi:hypothetical protein